MVFYEDLGSIDAANAMALDDATWVKLCQLRCELTAILLDKLSRVESRVAMVHAIANLTRLDLGHRKVLAKYKVRRAALEDIRFGQSFVALSFCVGIGPIGRTLLAAARPFLGSIGSSIIVLGAVDSSKTREALSTHYDLEHLPQQLMG